MDSTVEANIERALTVLRTIYEFRVIEYAVVEAEPLYIIALVARQNGDGTEDRFGLFFVRGVPSLTKEETYHYMAKPLRIRGLVQAR